MTRMPRAAAYIPLAAVLLGLACATPTGRLLSKIAGIDRTGVVDRIDSRGGYLDLDLSGTRLFVPDDTECRATLTQRNGLRYLDRGRFGRIVARSGGCPVIGFIEPLDKH